MSGDYNKGETATVLAGCGLTLVVMLLLTPIAALIDAWVLVKLWAWFIMPQFEVAHLSIPTAAGFSLIAALLFFRSDTSEKGDWTDALARLIASMILNPIIVLFAGWLIFAVLR